LVGLFLNYDGFGGHIIPPYIQIYTL
jgi:hypothetical protein